MTLPADQDDDHDVEEELDDPVARRQSQIRELSWLFGNDIAEQADQVDIADINMNKDITEAIASGVKNLKELAGTPQAQRTYVASLEPGARILLCLWILDMDLLDKIQARSYLE